MSVTRAQKLRTGDTYRTSAGREYEVVDADTLEVLLRADSGATKWFARADVRERLRDGTLEYADPARRLFEADPDALVGETIEGRHRDGTRERGVVERVSDACDTRTIEIRTADGWIATIYPEMGEWEVAE